MRGDTRGNAPTGLELAVAAQITVFLIGVSWAFGGNADWVRTPISIWGSLGTGLTLVIVAARGHRGRIIPGSLAWALPVLVLCALVLLSCLTPGYRRMASEGGAFLMPLNVPWWVPSAALPGVTLSALWLFSGIYFSAFNLALAVRDRGVIRMVLAVAVGNALVLAVFGTIQKLVGSGGIYFGAIRSPQDYFFASFVYDNHWGAFMILMIGACAGLTLRYAFGSRGEGFFRGPSFAGLVAASLLAVSVPLSGSRACTLMLGILLVVALWKGAPKIADSLGASGADPALALVGILLMTILAIFGAWIVAGDVVRSRASMAKAQIAAIVSQGGLGTRAILYRDTLRMARERPAFGWGMGSFPSVFPLYNSQKPGIDRIPVVYHDAHSDWLQSIAEIGCVGTLLIGASVALPARVLFRRHVSKLPYFLAAGCILVAAYAWVEFPFGNVAVVLAWWLCFFSSVQYLRLSGHAEMLPRGS